MRFSRNPTGDHSRIRWGWPKRPRRPKLDAPGGDARIARLISGAVAQLGERRVRNAKVEGSIPFRSTISPGLLAGDKHPYRGRSHDCGRDPAEHDERPTRSVI